MSKKPEIDDGDEVEGATKLTRINPDLHEKLRWLLKVIGEKSAQYLDPLIRDQIESDYAAHEKDIEVLKRLLTRNRKKPTDDAG